MILDSALLRLEAVLAGAVSANQPEVIVDYIVWNVKGEETPPSTFRVPLNSNTDVTILAACANAGERREPIRVSIYNKDTASVTVTVKTDDTTTERIIIKATLLTLESLHWDKANGWYALDANGNMKQAGSSNFGALTATSITDSGLTSGRVTFAGVGGLLSDDSDLTFTTDTLTATKIATSLLTLTGAVTGNSASDITINTNKFTVAASSGNTVIAGTLAVTGVATLTAQPILSSLSVSSAVATDGSKGLVSVTNTGSGNNVLATSPTLTTPILGVAAATSINFGVTALNYYGEASWTPTAANFTVVGSPTYAGTYTRIGNRVLYEIQVSASTSIASTVNSSSLTLPFTPAKATSCVAVNTTTDVGGVGLTYTDGKAYPPSWSATSAVNTVSGQFGV